MGVQETGGKIKEGKQAGRTGDIGARAKPFTLQAKQAEKAVGCAVGGS